MKLALGLINPVVGDLKGNLTKIMDQVQEAIRLGADLVIFSEMSLVGYPPRDLIEYPALKAAQNKTLTAIKKQSRRITIVVGGFTVNRGRGRPLHNVAFVFQKGKMRTYAKQLLPQYDVFDEDRYFEPGKNPLVFSCAGKKIGLTICEDIWASDPKLRKRYTTDPVKVYQRLRPDILLNLSASPFETGKLSRRVKLLKQVARRVRAMLIYINQVGANDDLIFDGGGFVLDASGACRLNLPRFTEGLFLHDLETPARKAMSSPENEIPDICQALVLGISDYAHKTGHTRAVLGLSGGIDSAVVAALACRALGAENVTGVLLPSRYSSPSSVTDAQDLISKLGMKVRYLEIDPLHQAFEEAFKKLFASDTWGDITAQNLQARIRGVLLMALANESGALLLNTTNKSEMAMGYGTLYGDLCGALAVISDLTKNQVYKLAGEINHEKEIISSSILTKEPSAELKPSQRDSDSLPPYDILDPIVHTMIVEKRVPALERMSPLHRSILQSILQTEYKRRQAPVGLKISGRAFGPGRRFPIVARLSD